MSSLLTNVTFLLYEDFINFERVAYNNDMSVFVLLSICLGNVSLEVSKDNVLIDYIDDLPVQSEILNELVTRFVYNNIIAWARKSGYYGNLRLESTMITMIGISYDVKTW